VNLCRADLSILKVIGCRRDGLHCRHPGQRRKEVQSKGHLQPIETGGWRQRPDDETSANAEFSGIEKEGLTTTPR
jgi:hypothetical protein